MSTLRRGVLASAIIHAFAVAFALGLFDSESHSDAVVVDRSVDVEIAPRPPKAEAPMSEVATTVHVDENELPRSSPESPEPRRGLMAERRDAGVDAIAAAAPKKQRRPRTRPDAGLVARSDAGPGDGDAAQEGDAGAAAVASASDAGPAEMAQDAGLTDQPVDSAITASEVDPASAFVGTAANLLSYFPPGQVVTALVRFDRLRDTEWADDAEALLRPMPDYRALFGSKNAEINSKIDILAISSARPRDAKATTLVMKTALSRAKVRELLANPAAPIAWSAAGGGLLGKREGGDSRVLLSPWREWYLLAAAHDFSGLLSPAAGELDTVEAKQKLPAWLSSIRAIEGEAGDGQRGPALVVTLGRIRKGSVPSSRYAVPQFGLGVASLPMPVRASIAMELVKQGWLIRGTMRFATEVEASEFVHSVRDARQRVLDSFVLSALLSRQHASNALAGLSLLQSGAGVSYATSISIADARALLPAVAAELAAHFGQP